MSMLGAGENERSSLSEVAAEIATCGNVDAAADLLIAAAQTGRSDGDSIVAMARLLAREEDEARVLGAFGKIAEATRGDPRVGSTGCSAQTLQRRATPTSRPKGHARP